MYLQRTVYTLNARGWAGVSIEYPFHFIEHRLHPIGARSGRYWLLDANFQHILFQCSP